MHIGFTGTRQSMTPAQEGALRELLASHPDAVLHHGDAIGADAQAHDIAVALGCRLVIHPPVDGTDRAFKHSSDVRAPRPYLDRNRDIVRETELLIAAPAEATEQLRSGTWSTVRYARKLRRLIVLVLPDGRVPMTLTPVALDTPESGP
jgi:hypothetical protein